MNYFSEIGGFDAILNILKSNEMLSKPKDKEDNNVPLELVSTLTSPFRCCNNIFAPTFTENFVTSIKEIVINRIRNMSEKEIKEIDKEVVSKVLGDMKDFLSLHYTE